MKQTSNFVLDFRNGTSDLESSDTNIAYTAKSNPVNMPANYSKNQAVPLVPLYIESGSSSKYTCLCAGRNLVIRIYAYIY